MQETTVRFLGQEDPLEKGVTTHSSILACSLMDSGACWAIVYGVTESCLTPSDPMDCSPPGSSIHGIFQARVLEWGAIAFSAIWCYADQYGSH